MRQDGRRRRSQRRPPVGPEIGKKAPPFTLPDLDGNEVSLLDFRGEVVLPEECRGQPVFVRARTGGETLFLVDGECRGVFDGTHPVVMMALQGIPGQRYRLALEAYAGHSFPGAMPDDRGLEVRQGERRFDGVELLLERPEVTGFVFDLRVLRQVMQVLDEHSLRRHHILGGLAQVYALITAMPEEQPEES